MGFECYASLRLMPVVLLLWGVFCWLRTSWVVVVTAICFAWLTNVLCVRLDALVWVGLGLCFWVLWFLDVILV